MACFSGAKTVKTGLVLHLDAANIKSKATGVTALTDLLSKSSFSYQNNTSTISIDTTNKSLNRSSRAAADHLRSASTINLPTSFTMSTLALVKESDTNANLGGLLTSHDHGINAGGGITVRYISATDYRISCNTGDGASRTYSSYYGTTNIKDRWSYLVFRFIKETNMISLWVNGVKEYEQSYAMTPSNNYVDLFNWSTSFGASNNYRVRGEIALASVHNLALSDESIKQNFNAVRGRYSI